MPNPLCYLEIWQKIPSLTLNPAFSNSGMGRIRKDMEPKGLADAGFCALASTDIF